MKFYNITNIIGTNSTFLRFLAITHSYRTAFFARNYVTLTTY